MSITTYSELKTAIANWIDRDDLTSRIPEFIALAEARFANKLRVREMETQSTVAMTASQDYIDLPAGFCAMVNAYVDGTTKRPLEMTSLANIYATYGGSTSGKPYMGAVSGSKMYLGPTPDSAYDAILTYYKFDVLSDSNTSNFLLSRRPDIYLRAAQAEAETYVGNDQRAGALLMLVEKELEDFENAEMYAGMATPIQRHGVIP